MQDTIFSPPENPIGKEKADKIRRQLEMSPIEKVAPEFPSLPPGSAKPSELTETRGLSLAIDTSPSTSATFTDDGGDDDVIPIKLDSPRPSSAPIPTATTQPSLSAATPPAVLADAHPSLLADAQPSLQAATPSTLFGATTQPPVPTSISSAPVKPSKKKKTPAAGNTGAPGAKVRLPSKPTRLSQLVNMYLFESGPVVQENLDMLEGQMTGPQNLQMIYELIMHCEVQNMENHRLRLELQKHVQSKGNGGGYNLSALMKPQNIMSGLVTGVGIGLGMGMCLGFNVLRFMLRKRFGRGFLRGW
ncbi:hypothetical protein QBC44DRAFT_385345 [Cladorrhinum sp. PSN332]|nr:hypothetical protein QBC44DRAFT_385345 [Cladorrhinum sp. PSN332]